MNKLFLFLIPLISFVACNKDEMSNFDDSYIKIEYLGDEIQTDTIIFTINDYYALTVKSQSNNSSKPRFYKKIDNLEIVNISETNEIVRISQTYGSGYREISDIIIDLNNGDYENVEILNYIIRIGDKNNGEILKTIYIKIE